MKIRRAIFARSPLARAADSNLAFQFHPIKTKRQIRISGPVERTSREDSAAYFHSRPPGSRLAAWASKQSEVIDARKVLDARFQEFAERFADEDISLPPHWGGYRVKPEQMEFWQGRP